MEPISPLILEVEEDVAVTSDTSSRTFTPLLAQNLHIPSYAACASVVSPDTFNFILVQTVDHVARVQPLQDSEFFPPCKGWVEHWLQF